MNKVIGENEKCVFHFMEKTKWTFWPTQYNDPEPQEYVLTFLLNYVFTYCF